MKLWELIWNMPNCEFCGKWYLWNSQADNCCKSIDDIDGNYLQHIVERNNERNNQDNGGSNND